MGFNMGIQKTAQQLHKDSRGFTLLEVTIAMAVLAIALLGVTSMQVNAVHNVTVGNLYSQANVIANQHLEFLKNIDLDTLDGWEGNVENNVSATRYLDSDPDFDGSTIFTRTTRVFDTDDGIDVLEDTKFCRLIEVRVSWRRAGAKHGSVQRTVRVSSLSRGEGI